MEETRCADVQDMLRARDERAARQEAFLSRHAAPLISFTMNIAGAIKRDRLIDRAFWEGVERVEKELGRMNAPVLEKQQTLSFTGCEMLWAVDAGAQALKLRMCLLEEMDALGRLFDLDVIDPGGAHLSRSAERRCLICGAPVRACARSRAHPAQELYEKAHEIIRAHFEERFIRRVGEMAQRALLYEAAATPKPGLVDCENSGSHSDMDLFSFLDSAVVLRSYFESCVRMGLRGAGADALQLAGRQAEERMYAAARANTHKGAVFSLGILCWAMGRAGEEADMDAVLQFAADMGQSYLDRLRQSNPGQTGGEQQYRRYGLPGARGEAASGFCTVIQTGLPALEEALARGCSLQEAGLHALICLMAQLYDSNIIRRAGMEGQEWVFAQAREALRRGPGCLREMNERFAQRRISPGGSADLLAVTYFLHFCKEGER